MFDYLIQHQYVSVKINAYSNSSEDEIKFSDRHSNTLKEKDTDGSNFDRQGTIKLYFKDENKSMEHKLKHSFDRLDSSNSEDEKVFVSIIIYVDMYRHK